MQLGTNAKIGRSPLVCARVDATCAVSVQRELVELRFACLRSF